MALGGSPQPMDINIASGATTVHGQPPGLQCDMDTSNVPDCSMNHGGQDGLQGSTDPGVFQGGSIQKTNHVLLEYLVEAQSQVG